MPFGYCKNMPFDSFISIFFLVKGGVTPPLRGVTPHLIRQQHHESRSFSTPYLQVRSQALTRTTK